MAFLSPTVPRMRDGFLTKTFGESFSEYLVSHSLRRPVDGLDLIVDNRSHSIRRILHQAREAASNQEATLLVLDYVPDDAHGIVLKQTPFRAYERTAREGAELSRNPPASTIFFETKDDGLVGISLSDAFHKNCGNIKGSDGLIPLDYQRKTTIKIYIKWVGYEDKFYQFHLQNERKEPGPITMQKFIRHVARRVKDFVEKDAKKANDHNRHYQYRIGEGEDRLPLEEIWLAGVVSTSGGTIMPLLQLGPRRPQL
ncbi:hypothetical protein EWM64_g8073 [Hericium alpestre]|uniref:Uncharacterized protein n=1 Tax=Hericium alpestre TaxID=135208 RepID=A0A4Y9ZR38_9AGAM|nr:hypothetical protein EWM64_g8073 [Hericium alpestre]